MKLLLIQSHSLQYRVPISISNIFQNIFQQVKGKMKKLIKRKSKNETQGQSLKKTGSYNPIDKQKSNTM